MPGANAAANLISLKDEYRNMAGSVLPQTNDPMPNINTNKQGWGTDAAGTDLTEGDKYKGLINVKGAKFLDLVNSSSVKIDDADDLKEALDKYDVEMSIAFNDNPDNDEFRKAYIVVITGLEKKGTTPVGPETSGVVKLTGDAVGQATISDDTVTTQNSDGTTKASFTLTLPEWAAPDVAATSGKTHVTVTYDVYVGGELWSEDNAVRYGDTSGGTVVNNNLVAKDAKGATPAAQGKIATVELDKFAVITGGAGIRDLVVGKKVELRITDITYDAVRVQYKDNGSELVLGSGTPTEFLPTAKADAATITTLNIANTTKYGATASAAKYSVTGAKKSADDKLITDAAWDNTNASAAVYADGDGYVVVNITGLSASKMVDATSTKFDVASTDKALFGAAVAFSDMIDGETATDTLKLQVFGNVANTCDEHNTDAATGTADSTGNLIGAAHVGDVVSVKDVFGNVGAGSAAAYKVTYTITNGTETLAPVTKTYAANTAKASEVLASFIVKGAISVDVKVEAVAAPKLKTASYDADKAELTLTFDQELKEATVTSAAFDLNTNWANGNGGVRFTGVGSDTEKPITIVSNTKDGATIIVRLQGSTAAAIDGTGECSITLKVDSDAIQSIDGIKVKADKITFTALTSGNKTVTNA